MTAENNTIFASGTRPSRLWLPKLDSPPATIVDYLIARFPHVPPAVWRSRVSRGLIHLSDGRTLRDDSSYQHGITVYYRKEVPFEPELREHATVLYRDENILVIDKPHGMTVTPAGQYLERSIIIQLERLTGLTTLAPVHRLDRETAGLVLVAIDVEARGPYHQLFAEKKVEREYLAVARLNEQPRERHWRVENRIEAGEPWFRQRIVEGRPNAVTQIELLEIRERIALFRLAPQTGKKHQLRLHMASRGFPILGDSFYPLIREKTADEIPLQLLASGLGFIDPLNGEQRSFQSQRKLLW